MICDRKINKKVSAIKYIPIMKQKTRRKTYFYFISAISPLLAFNLTLEFCFLVVSLRFFSLVDGFPFPFACVLLLQIRMRATGSLGLVSSRFRNSRSQSSKYLVRNLLCQWSIIATVMILQQWCYKNGVFQTCFNFFLYSSSFLIFASLLQQYSFLKI